MRSSRLSTRTSIPPRRTSNPASRGYRTLSPASTPVTSAPTAVTIPVRHATAAVAEAGRISPERVSVSSETGWMTTNSSSGSSVTSMLRDSSITLTRYARALQETQRPARFGTSSIDKERRREIDSDHRCARAVRRPGGHRVGAEQSADQAVREADRRLRPPGAGLLERPRLGLDDQEPLGLRVLARARDR